MKRICACFAIAGACLLLAPAPGLATVHQVSVANFAFTPAHVTVALGDSVRWVWIGGMHTATSGDTVACSADGLFFDQPLDVTHPSFTYVPAAAGFIPYICRFHCLLSAMHGTIRITDPAGIGEPTFAASAKARVLAAAPNPFTERTELRFELAREGALRIEVFDPAGRLVSTLVDRILPAGPQSVAWDGRDGHGGTVPGGIYFALVQTAGGIESRSLILLRGHRPSD